MNAVPKPDSILGLMAALKDACDALDRELHPDWERDPKYAKALECAKFEAKHTGPLP